MGSFRSVGTVGVVIGFGLAGRVFCFAARESLALLWCSRCSIGPYRKAKTRAGERIVARTSPHRIVELVTQVTGPISLVFNAIRLRVSVLLHKPTVRALSFEFILR